MANKKDIRIIMDKDDSLELQIEELKLFLNEKTNSKLIRKMIDHFHKKFIR